MRLTIGPLEVRIAERGHASLIPAAGRDPGGRPLVRDERSVESSTTIALRGRWIVGALRLAPTGPRTATRTDPPLPTEREAPRRWSAGAVANAFAELAARDGLDLDNFKLQGLVYNAHAWSLAERRAPLLDEAVAAMPWGPALRSIMREKGAAITVRSPVSEIAFAPGGSPPLRSHALRIDDPAVLGFLEDVYDHLRDDDGVAITRAACGEREPWHFVRSVHEDLRAGPAMPDGLIATCFMAKLRRSGR